MVHEALAAKRDTRYEVFELSKPNVAHPPPTSTTGAIRTWYSRIILRSGKGYSPLPEKNRETTVFHGWRFGALFSCVLVGICLTLNVVATIYVLKSYPPGIDSFGVLIEGDCKKVRSYDSKFHYAINVIATVLVAASNYNMQCLTAPTRSEIDKAHAKSIWLDIGVHSVRNLRHVSPGKAVLWLALLVSTFPLHLLWNSAVFTTTTFNDYSGLVVTKDFLVSNSSLGIDCSEQAMDEHIQNDQSSYVVCWLHQHVQQNSTSMIKMTPEQCMTAYATGIEASNFNFLAVTKDATIKEQSKQFRPGNATLPVVAYFNTISYTGLVDNWCRGLCQSWGQGNNETKFCFDTDWNALSTPFSCQHHVVNGTGFRPKAFTQRTHWMCNTDAILYNECDNSAALKNASDWTILPEKYQIDHCLATSAGHPCQLQYSQLILTVAIACNAVKFGSIFLYLFFCREPILATIGDGATSFLCTSDWTSKGKCLTSKFTSKWEGWMVSDRDIELHSDRPNSKPLQWIRDEKFIERWYQGASWKRWGLCILLWLCCIIVGVVFLLKGIARVGLSNIFSVGFGALDLSGIVSTSSYQGGSAAAIITTSLLANLPQLLLSGLYFMSNACITGMAMAAEWSLFSQKRRSLRVTVPSGHQRETYWLQLPWKFSLPLLACSTVLHWLVSQSIFLINLRIFQPNNELLREPTDVFPGVSSSGVITACGYSPLAIVCAVSVGTLMLLALLVLSSQKLKPGIPIVGSNSFTISAACHPPKEDEDVAFKHLMWGAVSHQEGNLPGHCCLTSLDVEKPRCGNFYAG
ncbi:hypothetical protein GJ744_004618 [Endocarpon pusillum]|uniref:DUF6536 domain-containing protein n=1 Tax=Endocarpon pusillum TaxID=364733 RepID=A0A8H7AQ13_9EURO|nr:hypothetical protein GJ744_004618 [Endocarpon pusillum]